MKVSQYRSSNLFENICATVGSDIYNKKAHEKFDTMPESQVAM